MPRGISTEAMAAITRAVEWRTSLLRTSQRNRDHEIKKKVDCRRRDELWLGNNELGKFRLDLFTVRLRHLRPKIATVLRDALSHLDSAELAHLRSSRGI